MTFSRIEKILIAGFLIAVFLWSFNQLKESDSFYHLKAGELIWQTQNIPHADVFSMSAQGAPWVTHEWLAELIFYGMWHLTGFWGLMAFVAALAALTYFLLLRIALLRGANLAMSVIIFLAFGALTFELWIPRPQVFSYLFFALLLYCLESYRARKNVGYLWGAAGTMVLWANTNASVPLGVIVAVLWAGCELLKREISPKILLGLIIGTFAAAFINPNTYHVFTYAQEIKPAAEAFGVLEWKSILVSFSRIETKIFLLEIFIGIVLIFGFFVARYKLHALQKRDFFPIALVLGMSVLPFISIRHVGYWPLAAGPYIAVAVSTFLSKRFAEKQREMIIMTATIIILIISGRALALPREYFNPHLVPVYAADYLQENNIHGSFFHLYNEGGYFLFRWYPKEKVFIDGRSEVYAGLPTAEFFAIVSNGPATGRLIEEKYHFNAVILAYRPDSLAKSIAPLVKYLVTKGWPLVYWDDTSLIFLRPTQENAVLIARDALLHVNPYRPVESIPQGEAKAAGAELQALLGRVQTEGSAMVQEYAERFLRAQTARYFF